MYLAQLGGTASRSPKGKQNQKQKPYQLKHQSVMTYWQQGFIRQQYLSFQKDKSRNAKRFQDIQQYYGYFLNQNIAIRNGKD